MSGVPAIEARGLGKTYGGAWGRTGQTALIDLSLGVEAGAAFGLIGQNGAGKTTFIKLLLGVVRPTRGEVRVLGGSPDDPKVRRRIGYLPERLHLPEAWRPREFLASVARMKGLGTARPALDALIDRVGLADAAHRKIGGYSKGMRQRLGLAAALLGEPELLVLDEPTDGIDPLGRVEIRKLLADESARGATLFLNSHLLAETERICQRIGILAAGRLITEGPLETLRAAGRSWRVQFAEGARPQALEAAGFSRAKGAWHFSGEDVRALNDALDAARRSGALIVSVEPASRDLEQVLADAMGAGAAA